MSTRLVVALALILAACTAPATRDAEATVASPAVSSTTTSSPESPPADLETIATTSTDRAVPVPDGPPAPDFTLALGDGGTFMLAQETRPVYLVFWAEW